VAPQQTRIQVGRFKLTGPVVWLVLAAIVAAIAYLSPPLANRPMWVSALGWLAFSSYWAAAGKNAAAAKDAESKESRRVHELLMQTALLLLFIPIPGLRRNFLPAATAWIPVGLAFQAASIALAVWARRHLGRNWSGRIEIKADHQLIRTGPCPSAIL
jgi:hypothetical protein